jgi:arylsulfatase A-like enzyme
MFERGYDGHGSNMLYQPLIRIPLLIFEPGRDAGMNIHEHTSAIDVLPTLLHVTGQKPPDWGEGVIMPPYTAANPDPDRNVYVVQSIDNPQNTPLLQASTVLVKDRYKLHYYFGYPEIRAAKLIRLFDIESDPEEMVDLSKSKKGTARELFNELKRKLELVNEPYQ